MKQINMLTYWQYDVTNAAFSELRKNLNIDTCFYFTEERIENNNDNKLIPIYLYESIDFYTSGAFENEIDDELIQLMRPYETMCMDVIYRWRRSYSDKEDYKTIKQIYYSFLRYWNDFIIREKIDLFVLNIMPHIPNEYIPYALCKAKNIPTILLGVMPFVRQEKTNYILKAGIEELDANFLDRYNGNKGSSEPIVLSDELMRYFRLYNNVVKEDKRVVFYNQRNKFSDVINMYKERIAIYIKRRDYSILLNKIKYLAHTRMETKSFMKKVEAFEEEADLNKDFYLFALHLQPEATTLPTAGIFSDQLLAIRMISKCLDDNTYLYVKEHPSYWIQKGRLESVFESRSIGFYEEIGKLKNVKLINHHMDSKKLIEKCKAVVTVTGTIGFEAMFAGKPVLTFGPTFYEYFPSVFRIKTNKDCAEAIRIIHNSTFCYDEDEIKKYLKAIEKYVVLMGMNEKNFIDNGVPEVDDEDRRRMVDKITQFYNEYYK